MGFSLDEYAEIFNELKTLENVRSITHMTHFSDADGQRFGQEGIQHQYEIFQKTTQPFEVKTSLSNSAAILRHSGKIKSDIVRSGIMLLWQLT